MPSCWVKAWDRTGPARGWLRMLDSEGSVLTRCPGGAGVTCRGDRQGWHAGGTCRGDCYLTDPFLCTDPSSGGPSASEERVAQEALEALQLEKRLSLLSHSGRPGSGGRVSGWSCLGCRDLSLSTVLPPSLWAVQQSVCMDCWGPLVSTLMTLLCR